MDRRSSRHKVAMRYADSMMHHNLGHALYQGISTAKIYPGAIGYFNTNGQWIHITSLQKLRQSPSPSGAREPRGMKGKLSPLEPQINLKVSTETLQWEPKRSAYVMSHEDGSFGLDTRFPVSVIDPWSGRFAPQLGAVLATPGPVAHASIKTPRRLQDWIRLNQRVFPRYYWEARRNDLWIITSTYSTADMWLKVWEDTAAVIRVRFSGGAARHEVSAGDGVFCRDESWLHYSAENADEGLVCFAGGIRVGFNKDWFLGKKRVSNSGSRMCTLRMYSPGEKEMNWTSLHYVGANKGKRSQLKPLDPYDGAAEESALVEYDVPGLIDAAASGHIGLVRTILATAVPSPDQNGRLGAALRQAAASGYGIVVNTLIQAGADVNALRDDTSPLIEASKAGHKNIVQMLLEAGADPNVSGWPTTALAAASHKGHEGIVSLLLAAGADVQADEVLKGPCKRGYDACIRILLAAGADINDPEDEGETPLCVAILNGCMNTVRLLVDAGADVNRQAGENGRTPTPLITAVTCGNREVVEFLLASGADIYPTGGEQGTAIAAAAFRGDKDMVRLLLEEMDKRGGREFGPALKFAMKAGSVEMFEFLLASGADVNGIDATPVAMGTAPANEPPLTAATKLKAVDFVSRLLSAGADPNVTESNWSRQTALHIASAAGDVELVRRLLEAEANIHPPGNWSPLHLAARNGHLQVLLLLIEAGANLQLTDSRGHTARDMALLSSHTETVIALFEAQQRVSDNISSASGVNDINQAQGRVDYPQNRNVRLRGRGSRTRASRRR